MFEIIVVLLTVIFGLDIPVGKMMNKDESGVLGGSATAAAVAAVEKQLAIHGMYGMPPNSSAIAPSQQEQRPMKRSGGRGEPQQEEQDFFSAQHSK